MVKVIKHRYAKCEPSQSQNAENKREIVYHISLLSASPFSAASLLPEEAGNHSSLHLSLH